MVKKGDKIIFGKGDSFGGQVFIIKDKKYEVVRTDDKCFYVLNELGSEQQILISRLSTKCKFYDEYLLQNIVGERREKLNNLK
jgi:hypothetical protein